MFQLVENALADGDVDYYRFFQECKKCKNLGRKQISTRSQKSRYSRCTKVCKDALSYISSSVTSLMFQLVIMVIIPCSPPLSS